MDDFPAPQLPHKMSTSGALSLVAILAAPPSTRNSRFLAPCWQSLLCPGLATRTRWRAVCVHRPSRFRNRAAGCRACRACLPGRLWAAAGQQGPRVEYYAAYSWRPAGLRGRHGLGWYGATRPFKRVRWHSVLIDSSPDSTWNKRRTMLYKLAIFASALLAGARAEVRSPCRTG